MYLKIMWVYKLVSRIRTHVQPRAFLLVDFSKRLPARCFPSDLDSLLHHTQMQLLLDCAMCTTGTNSSAADKSLVAVGYPESAPSRVLHSCLSLPTGAITAWK